MKRITSITLAAATALSIAVTPAPAAADNSDLVKVLGGLLILGATAKVIEDRKDRKAKAARIQQDEYPPVIDGQLRNPNRAKGPKAGRGYKRNALPQRCLRTLETSRRDRSVYGLRCLSRHYQHVSKLPEHCAIRVRTDRGIRTVFGARCLRRDGWRVAGLH